MDFSKKREIDVTDLRVDEVQATDWNTLGIPHIFCFEEWWWFTVFSV